jgi:hypothetical protein
VTSDPTVQIASTTSTTPRPIRWLFTAEC